MFRTQLPKYLNFFKSAYGLSEQEVSRIQNFSVGEALVKLSDDLRPFFVKVEMEEIKPEQTCNPETKSCCQSESGSALIRIDGTTSECSAIRYDQWG